MSKLNLFLSVMILGFGHVASAKADPACAKCSEYEQLSIKLNGNDSEDVIADALITLGDLATGRVKTLSQVEADALIKLEVALLKADKAQNGGDAGSQLANIYKRHPKVIDQAVRKLSPEDQAFVTLERKLGAQRLKGGNG